MNNSSYRKYLTDNSVNIINKTFQIKIIENDTLIFNNNIKPKITIDNKQAFNNIYYKIIEQINNLFI